MKGINYLASVIKTYRHAIDACYEQPETYQIDPGWKKQLYQVFHREYCTGFYFNDPNDQSPNYQNRHQGKIHSFIGKILEKKADGSCIVGIRNKLTQGDTVEVISPLGDPKQEKIDEMLDTEGSPIVNAHPNTRAVLKLKIQCHPNDIVRKYENNCHSIS